MSLNEGLLKSADPFLVHLNTLESAGWNTFRTSLDREATNRPCASCFSKIGIGFRKGKDRQTTPSLTSDTQSAHSCGLP